MVDLSGDVALQGSGTRCLAAASVLVAGQPTLISTTDGGLHWQIESHGPGTGLFPKYLSCAPESITDCVLIGGDLTTPSKSPYAGRLSLVSYTTDGGSTWMRGKLPAGQWSVGPAACPTTAVCFATARQVILSHPYVTYVPAVLLIVDGGANWTEFQLPPGSPVLDSISCGDADHCVAVGSMARDAKHPSLGGTTEAVSTANGGRTWKLTSITPSDGGDRVACVSDEDCLVVSLHSLGDFNDNTQVWSSTDGGATWNKAGSIPESGPVYLSCSLIGTCVTSGVTESSPTKAVIYAEDAGTNNWHLVHTSQG